MAKKDIVPKPVVLPELPFKFIRFDMGRVLPLADQIIKHRGTPVTLTPHVICPCVDSPRSGHLTGSVGTGRAIPDCPSCSGSGLAYIEEKTEKTLAVVSGVNDIGRLRESGLSANGQISLLFRSKDQIAEGDRVQLYQSPMPVRYNRTYKDSVGGMKLPFDVLDVHELVTNNPSTLELIVLRSGHDFFLNQVDNTIIFPPNGKVRHGSKVSGVFLAAPYFIIDTLTSTFRGQTSLLYSKDGSPQWLKMPQAATATRADILFARFHRDVSERGDIHSGEGS